MKNKPRQPRWLMEQVIGHLRLYARRERNEIIVRVENDGDTTKYAELGYPILLDIGPAIELAAKETRPEDIRA